MSPSTGSAVRPKSSFVQKHPLIAFFLLATGLTWVFLVTDALGSRGIIPFRLPLPLLLVMGYMPTLAAVIVTGATQGRAGIRDLFRKLLIARVAWPWYAFAIFATAAVCVATVLLYNALGAGESLPIPSAKTSSLSGPMLIPSIVLLFLISGIINGEELAWRGFALPRLQARYTALQSSLTLGPIWGLFHLPLFFTAGSSQEHMSFLGFLVSTTALTVLFTWLFNNTRGSVLLAYLFHASQNTWTQVFTVDHARSGLDWILAGLFVLLAVIVILAAGPEHLARSSSRIQES